MRDIKQAESTSKKAKPNQQRSHLSAVKTAGSYVTICYKMSVLLYPAKLTLFKIKTKRQPAPLAHPNSEVAIRIRSKYDILASGKALACIKATMRSWRCFARNAGLLRLILGASQNTPSRKSFKGSF
jgi:hypothetical protein